MRRQMEASHSTYAHRGHMLSGRIKHSGNSNMCKSHKIVQKAYGVWGESAEI